MSSRLFTSELHREAIIRHTSPSARGALILLIDDEESARDATALFLRIDNHEIVSVGSAADALDQLQLMSRPPDIIVTDFNLGGDVTGAELIQHVRAAIQKEIPAVLITGDKYRAAARSGSVSNLTIFQKPVDAEHLAQTIRSLVFDRS